ncbi:MAG: LysR family transcriptional regulator [Firmicutes bacterium]|nr:LysR family transcriptional regulator [Bacillota bacterium]
MDLHYLKLFHYIATEGSLSKAAERLYISQPALSMQIKKFEQDIGLKLFDKEGNRNVLNENGKVLFKYTQRLFKIIIEAENELLNASDHISGTVLIGGSNSAGTYILPRIIGEFKKQFPSVTVNLHVSDTREIAQLVAENKLDFAVNGGDGPYGNAIISELLMTDELLLIASPESQIARLYDIQPENLENIPIITHEHHSQLYTHTERIINQFKIKTSISMTLGSIDAIKQAVEADLGVSFIPKTALRFELHAGVLVDIRIGKHHFPYPQCLIYNKNRYLSPATKEFMRLVKDRFKHMK